MRKLAILTFVSADGVMQAPGHPDEDRSGGFDRGGWAADYWNEVMEQVMAEAMAESYDLLLGRKTYDTFASHWPHADDPIARKLNESTKYVVTSATDELQWKNSVKISGDIVEEITQLKKQEGPLLQIHGSWQLIQTLLSNKLIDEFRLWTFPLLIGSGKRLFADPSTPSNLELSKTNSTSNGVTMSFYRPIY
ncbi:dihydrofolate reductase family protein [Puniceicoccaceae bacterium K14]|nr:dihydrofolate reductase family protein [Puniceicoccaceae bacterium K14]